VRIDLQGIDGSAGDYFQAPPALVDKDRTRKQSPKSRQPQKGSRKRIASLLLCGEDVCQLQKGGKFVSRLMRDETHRFGTKAARNFGTDRRGSPLKPLDSFDCLLGRTSGSGTISDTVNQGDVIAVG
jgi:hypothetical protein